MDIDIVYHNDDQYPFMETSISPVPKRSTGDPPCFKNKTNKKAGSPGGSPLVVAAVHILVKMAVEIVDWPMKNSMIWLK